MIGLNKKKEGQKTPVNQSLTTDAYTDLMKGKQSYRMTIACLSFTVLILAFLVQGKKTEIVVMPADYYEPIIVNGKYANRSYIAGHALSTAIMLGNISSKNVEFVSKSFLRILSPRLQSILGHSLDTEAKLLTRKRARQTFEVDDVMFRDEDELVWVWGTKTTTVGNNSMRENFTYEFRIEPNNGMPKITHFDAYPGQPAMRNKEPVRVTPYLSRELALVKTYSPGEITISNDKGPIDVNEQEKQASDQDTTSTEVVSQEVQSNNAGE
jgi:conjugal transfer pilus assembly protein TraE